MDHENLNLSSGNCETRSSKLTDEDAKCRVEFETSYNYLRLVDACSKIASTSVKLERLNCSHWFYSEHRREYQSKLCTEHSSVHFAEMPENERYYTACKCLFDRV